jgi:hypothetical protein
MDTEISIADKILERTKQDVLLWDRDGQCGYVAVTEAVTIRVICDKKDSQIEINGVWVTVSPDAMRRICREISLQSCRRRAKYAFSELERAGL